MSKLIITQATLTDDQQKVLAQALADYAEGVEDNCEDEELAKFLVRTVEEIEQQLGLS